MPDRENVLRESMSAYGGWAPCYTATDLSNLRFLTLVPPFYPTFSFWVILLEGSSAVQSGKYPNYGIRYFTDTTVQVTGAYFLAYA
jgi:hypothetical protein